MQLKQWLGVMPNRKRIANKRACRERVPFSTLP
jgi:hypothetical protein